MGLLENIWFLLTFSITAIILITDSKDPASSPASNNMANLFSSSSKQQTFVTRLNWFLISLFFLLTLVLSYIG